MLSVFNALFPVFLVILTGAGLRVSGIVPDKEWRGFDSVTYYVLFPATLIVTMGKARLAELPVAGVGLTLFVSVVTMGLLLLAAKPLLEKVFALDGPAFTSLFQGATRWNTFVAIAVAGALYGAAGVAISAVAVAVMIPTLNVMAMLVLARYAHGQRGSVGGFLLALIRNPFIWSVLIGIALSLTQPPIPTVLWTYGDILSKAGLAAGLLMVGGGLELSALHRPRAVTALSCALKLALMPLIAALVARGLGVEGVFLQATVLCACVPTASGAYVLARKAGGDAPLMAEILTVQTLVGILTMPVVLSLV